MHLYRLVYLITLCFALTSLEAQIDIPVLRSTDTLLSIRVDDDYSHKSWTIAPELRPDAFVSGVSGQTVTFISDLDSITCAVDPERPCDFVVLLGTDSAYTQVRYEMSKLDILKEYADYDKVQQKDFPAYTYDPMDSPPLVDLRKKYKLDSIAGQGTDVSQMLNLMRWVHNTVEHDGNRPNGGSNYNADALLSSCGKGSGTLNCRGLGILLNEVYLAMGFPSHYVTCMPKDTNDADCHVINTAYSQSLDKWIWLDPTQNAYVMDEKGTLLSIPEVRERLVKDLPLILNPDANWNYRGTTNKAWYLEYYMAKNLYKFSISVNSTYDFETSSPGKEMKFLELWPAGTTLDMPTMSTFLNKSGVRHTTYITSNPSLFWTAPPKNNLR